MENDFKTLVLSSLAKVFPDEVPVDQSVAGTSALRGEVCSFQVAYWSPHLIKKIRVSVEGRIPGSIRVRSVGLAPSELPCYEDHDEYILRSTSGLYPDPMYPVSDQEGIIAFPGQWRSVWVTVEVAEDAAGGRYPLELRFHKETGEVLGAEIFHLEVIPASLEEQKLICTEWFYTDCLATWYQVEAFSERHWEWIDRYVQSAVRHGVNMILTPVFTPPLDTEIGHERPTMQLVDVLKLGDRYTFGLDKLDRWVELCLERGVQYFEISHLFTQWGAKHAPKIMAQEDGVLKRIFGWETDALGDEYRNFLSQFLPVLLSFCEGKQLRGRVYFHISDEPHGNDLSRYQDISRFIRSLIGDYPVMDALSDFSFYQSGAVERPIPSNDVIDVFIENKVEGLWTYYCCAQYKNGVANRFFNMPSVRNRILGVQMYKYNLVGFLHWGFNFWYSARSLKAVNPFTNTDAYYSFPSGDAFLVYPGEDGPIDSIRYEVFREALQDLRALQTLENRIGRERTLALLEQDPEKPLTFSEYPRDAGWLLSLREKVNQLIKASI